MIFNKQWIDEWVENNLSAEQLSDMITMAGLEVDSIVINEEGEYGAIEIKLGSNQIEEAKTNLLKFYEKVDKKPKFMCIICGLWNNVMKDPDTGIYIIPINALKP